MKYDNDNDMSEEDIKACVSDLSIILRKYGAKASAGCMVTYATNLCIEYTDNNVEAFRALQELMVRFFSDKTGINPLEETNDQ